jgi:hypothetical protein
MNLVDGCLKETEGTTDDGNAEEPCGTDRMVFIFKGLLPQSLPLIEGNFAEDFMHTIEVVRRRQVDQDKVAYLKFRAKKVIP